MRLHCARLCPRSLALTAPAGLHARSRRLVARLASAGKVWSARRTSPSTRSGSSASTTGSAARRPTSGLDCSGLVRHVFQEVTGVTLPRTAKEMSTLGAKVARTDLEPGDLVFFNTRRFAFSHVGIYLGDNRFIHAPSHGREVEIARLDAATGGSASTARGGWSACSRARAERGLACHRARARAATLVAAPTPFASSARTSRR